MISKDTIKNILHEQKKLFKDEYTQRTLQRTLQEKSSSDFIIIISGIRRCGKSVLMHEFRKTQKEQDYYFNFDDERLLQFEVEDFEKLYETLIELYGEQRTFYFDEIQNVKGWEAFIRRLHDYKNKIYITGSNANLLSKELGTRLTGRYLRLELYPANFKEFVRYHKVTPINLHDRNHRIQIKKLFEQYLEKGGFFKYLETNDKDFFKNLYENILYRDIISRYSIGHEKGIKDIFQFLVSNTAKEFSYKTLKTISNIASTTTIKDYIGYLEDSYLLSTIKIYDESVKKQLINPKKIYIVDSGLARTISFKFSEDKGRILENAIFLELKRQGKEIYYYKNKYECDFVIKEKNNITQAIQVCTTLQNTTTAQREEQGLLEAMKKFKLTQGTILTEDEENEITIDDKKIIIKPIWKWLIEQ